MPMRVERGIQVSRQRVALSRVSERGRPLDRPAEDLAGIFQPALFSILPSLLPYDFLLPAGCFPI